MQGIIFIGLQASGKSSFYKENFFHSHMRISMDLLNTRNKEGQFLEKCMELQQRVVIDNTNPAIADRKRYIDRFKENRYEIIGYYFQSKVKDSLKRNSLRKGKEKIPEAGIFATYKKLEIPSYVEGFDKLYYVEIVEGGFQVNEWEHEV